MCTVLVSGDEREENRLPSLPCFEATFWDQWRSLELSGLAQGVSGFLIKQNLFLVTHDASAKRRTDLGPLDLRMCCLCYSVNNWKLALLGVCVRLTIAK